MLHSGVTFDPLVLADDRDTFARLQVQEIQIGWLAMLVLCAGHRDCSSPCFQLYMTWVCH